MADDLHTTSGMMLDQVPPTLQTRLMQRIADFEATRAAPAIAQAQIADSRWEVRAAAYLALAAQPDAVTISTLKGGLADSDPSVRDAAAHALGMVQAAEAMVQAQPADQMVASHVGWRQSLRHGRLVLQQQARVLPRHWLAYSALLCLGYCLVLLFLPARQHLHDAALLLGIITTTATAIQMAAAVNLRQDLGLEVLLASPTAPHLIVLCRFALVVGVNGAASLALSALLALLTGHGLWGILQIWLGPLLFIAALTLALTLTIGSWLALLLTGALEVVQTLRFDGSGMVVPRNASPLWHTTPVILLLALACLGWAFWRTSRHAWHEITPIG
jgi:hypothetical protein